MTLIGFIQIGFFFLLLYFLTKPLGSYLAQVFSGEIAFLKPVEKGFYRLAGVEADAEQSWGGYAVSVLSLAGVSILFLFLLLVFQAALPFNPTGVGNVSLDMAFNIAVSFVTNTNWQAYVPEKALSPFVQMTGLVVQHFLSAATGLALALALIRGFARHESKSVGNFWVDLTRAVLYVLLPGSLFLSLLLVLAGVPQTLQGMASVTTLEGAKQTLLLGPVASQVAIKMFGTNGGGFFAAGSAHPFENPSPFSNLIEMISMVALPAAMTFLFGKMTGKPKQGWALFAAMMILSVLGALALYAAEAAPNPLLNGLPLDQGASLSSPGGNMEGKEVRFGIATSALFAALTTQTGCGATSASMDSLSPLGELIAMANIQLGEVIWGGVGSGLYGMLLFAVIAVFVAGLMVGRTPEYLGKKLEAKEIKMTMLAILILPFAKLGMTALAVTLPLGVAGMGAVGPHGFTQALYAFTSAAGNNGSALAGIRAGGIFYTLGTSFCMLIGRFGTMGAMLAIAGSLASKKRAEDSPGTFPTDHPVFVFLLVGVILIVGGLTFFPALALGPIVEHLNRLAGIAG